ncbi:MAG: peptidylprolyl isomerase [Armatimonadota bacterium]
MSITKFRKGFAAAGPVVAVLLGVAFIVGFLLVGSPGGPDPSDVQGQRAPAFAWEGEQGYVDELMAEVTTSLTPNATPTEEWRFREHALNVVLNRVAPLVLAKRAGLSVTDKDVEAMAKEEAEFYADLFRTQAQSEYDSTTARLTAEAQAAKEKGEESDEYKQAKKALDDHKALSLDEFVKKQAGQTLYELIKQQEEQLQQVLAEPMQRDRLRSQAARKKLQTKYESEVDTSEEALKRSYDELTFERILITEGANADPMGKAQDALNRIRSGMRFEDAAAEYSDTKKPDGSPDLSEMTLSRIDLMVMPLYRGVARLGEGEVSDPVQTPTGVAIYRVTKVEPKVPEDFEQKKTERANQLRASVAASMVTSGVEALIEGDHDKIQWHDEGWRLVFQLKRLVAGQGPTGAERRAEFQRIVDEAQGVVSSDADLPVYVRYMAFSQLYAEAPAGEKAALEELKAEVYAGVATVTRSTSFLFEYVDLLLEQKKGEAALEALRTIVANSWEINDTNRETIKKVERLKVQAANFAPPGTPAVEELQQALDDWYASERDQIAIEQEQEDAMREAEEANRRELEGQGGEPSGEGQPSGGGSGSADQGAGG